MHKLLLATTILISNFNFLLTTPFVNAQNPPAETFQPGFWQPVARVNPKMAITINLINKTDFKINYAVTEERMTPIVIEKEKSTMLKEVKVPIYLVIYPDNSNPNSSRINLKYDVSVDETTNILTVKIREVNESEFGNRTLNIQETGAIFLY